LRFSIELDYSEVVFFCDAATRFSYREYMNKATMVKKAGPAMDLCHYFTE
jgi:hypothetical protein